MARRGARPSKRAFATTVPTEFERLRPRRYAPRLETPVPEQRTERLVERSEAREESAKPLELVPATMTTALEPGDACEPEAGAPVVPSEDPPALCGEAALAGAPDALEQVALLREEAARFAAIACARALRATLADVPGTINRFVDDALRACGRVPHATVRLHPDDALAYRPQRDVDVIADPSCELGSVSVQTEDGVVAATIDQRAALLAKAAAHE
jgi:hypothetical protein